MILTYAIYVQYNQFVSIHFIILNQDYFEEQYLLG